MHRSIQVRSMQLLCAACLVVMSPSIVQPAVDSMSSSAPNAFYSDQEVGLTLRDLQHQSYLPASVCMSSSFSLAKPTVDSWQ